MEIFKSSRHSKITGDFAEALVLYWLSKYGFECARVDHTGIDLIARNPHNNELMGISVKSRCRRKGTEGTYVRIPKEDFGKARRACEAFACVPYFATVVDEADTIRVFLTQMDDVQRMCASGWRMGVKALQAYRKDPKVKIFEFASRTVAWWGDATRTLQPTATRGTEFKRSPASDAARRS